jgi:light-regulated signal transduction histidine kinase (bacteriophytochrome)
MPTAPSPDDSAATPDLARRLLEAMRPVCSHDLPNQAVALQSLLQLFAWDEAAQLSPQGREYFERLQSIANKTFALSQHLKELARLLRYEPRSETLTFAVVVDDVRAETQRADPECRWTWQCRWGHDSFRADRRLVQQALVQLLRVARTRLAGAMPAVDMESRIGADQCIDWTIAVAAAGEAPAVWPRAGDANEQQLALTLAQEYLAATGIVCRAGPAAPGVVAFTLVIPNRQPEPAP